MARLAVTAEKVAPQSGQPGPQPSASHGLLHHAEFNKLWFGQGVSAIGNQVTVVALPLTAVAYLKAGPFQVGLLGAAEGLVFLGPALLVGVLVDRVRRKPLMIGSDIGRTAVMAVVPALAWAGALNMLALYAVALVYGLLTVVFDLAYRSYLPTLVSSDVLLAGNQRLQSTDSVSQVVGPSVGGGLVQLIGAPFALLADAVSFVFSVLSLVWIRVPEPAPKRDGGGQGGLRGVATEIRSGLRFLRGSRVLRPLAGAVGTFNFFSQLQLTVIVLYAVRILHMSAGEVGILFGAFGAGGVLAAVTLSRALAWLGYGPMLVATLVLAAVAIAGLPLVTGSAAVATALLSALYFFAGFGLVGQNVISMTLRQIVTPAPLQGRVNASFRMIIRAVLPFAAVAAGLLGSGIGLRHTLIIAAAGVPLSLLWVAFSPVWRMRTLEEVQAGRGGPAP
ncbi:MAG TPA: MFS transporter [Streptosporangiaceae bacterium]|nr:MFS transporter [Streptosporangiaceae bacterium]